MDPKSVKYLSGYITVTDGLKENFHKRINKKKRVSVLGTLFIYLPNLGTFLGRYFRMTSLQVDCLNIPYHSACHYPVVLQRQMTSFSFCDA